MEIFFYKSAIQVEFKSVFDLTQIEKAVKFPS